MKQQNKNKTLHYISTISLFILPILTAYVFLFTEHISTIYISIYLLLILITSLTLLITLQKIDKLGEINEQ